MTWFEANAGALAGLGGVATVVAAVVAVFTLMRAGLDSASRSRPYIVVEYRVPEFAFKRMVLVVRNVGPTAARNVKVDFNPPFTTDGGHDRLAPYVARRYAQAIGVVGPGQELTSIVMVDTEDETKSDVPETLVAKVHYDAPWWRRGYRDRFVLQRVVYAEQVFTRSSDSVEGRLKTIAEKVTEIEKHHHNLVDALSDIPQSIAQASLLLAPRRPGVSWQVRHVTADLYAIDNVGDTAAESVELKAAIEHMIGPRVQETQDVVGPGESLTFLAAGSLASGVPVIEVSWVTAGDPSEPQTWARRLPN